MEDMDALLESDPVPENKADPVTPELMAEVERELEAFDAFFQAPMPRGCQNAPMVRPEKALLRTYIIARKTRRFPSVLEK